MGWEAGLIGEPSGTCSVLGWLCLERPLAIRPFLMHTYAFSSKPLGTACQSGEPAYFAAHLVEHVDWPWYVRVRVSHYINNILMTTGIYIVEDVKDVDL